MAPASNVALLNIHNYYYIGCGGDVHLSSGQITSPQWPDQYPNNVECQWQLVIPNGYHMKLNFTPPFEMEIQQPCINDYVQVI